MRIPFVVIVVALVACRDVVTSEVILRDGAGGGDDIAGDSNAAGDPLGPSKDGNPPGDPLPGDPLPGDPLPGDPLPGDPLPGDPLPGDPTAISPRIYNGSAAIPDGNTEASAAIGAAVEIDKTIVFHQATRNGEGDPENDAVTAELVDESGNGNASQILFRRAGNSNVGNTIQWSVVTFASGVTVQHGEHTLTSTADSVAIQPVTVASTFVISSWRNSGTSYNGGDWGIAELTTATDLTIRNTNDGATIRYQVVDMDGAVVQQRGIDVTSDELTTEDDASITAVDLTRTFLLASQEGVNPGNTRSMGARVHLPDETTVRCFHNRYSLEREVWVYVVQLPPGYGAVQQLVPTMADTVQSTTATITSVAPSRTTALSPFQGLLSARNSNWEADDAGKAMSHRFETTSATTVRVDRESGDMTIDYSFYVVEWTTQ